MTTTRRETYVITHVDGKTTEERDNIFDACQRFFDLSRGHTSVLDRPHLAKVITTTMTIDLTPARIPS